MDDTTGAPQDVGGTGQCDGSNAGDLKYAITAAQDGLMTATLTAGYDTLLWMRSACPGSGGDTLQCEGPPSPSMILLEPVTMGQTFWLIVDGDGTGDEGPFTLTVSLN
jgi:hypothetical protein